MPIEIKELVIKAVVDEASANSRSPAQKSQNSEEIISACVDQVMRILKEKGAR